MKPAYLRVGLPRCVAGAFAILAFAAVHGGAQVASDTAVTISWGAFVDTYYAWDADRPADFDRAFTTQPARYAEFNVNLAFVEARLSGPRIRGRVAVQAGTSVQANGAGEPRIGAVSGPSVSQFIQEATLGYRVSPSLWVDAGIFFSHIGDEGFISRDNLAYTRSLVSDFTPFYESGVKATWTPSKTVSTQVVVVNGWQNVSAENAEPAVGIRVDIAVWPALTLTYDNFIGNVAPDSAPSAVRVFNEVAAQYAPSPGWQLLATVDVGRQSRTAVSPDAAAWFGASLIARRRLTERLAVVGRVERLADPDQALVVTGRAVPFETNAASLGADMALTPRVLWRTEIRVYDSKHAVWPAHERGRFVSSDALAVSSLALTL